MGAGGGSRRSGASGAHLGRCSAACFAARGACARPHTAAGHAPLRATQLQRHLARVCAPDLLPDVPHPRRLQLLHLAGGAPRQRQLHPHHPAQGRSGWERGQGHLMGQSAPTEVDPPSPLPCPAITLHRPLLLTCPSFTHYFHPDWPRTTTTLTGSTRSPTSGATSVSGLGLAVLRRWPGTAGTRLALRGRRAPLAAPVTRSPALPRRSRAPAGALQTYQQDDSQSLAANLAGVTLPPGWGPIENVTVEAGTFDVQPPWQSGGQAFWFSECSCCCGRGRGRGPPVDCRTRAPNSSKQQRWPAPRAQAEGGGLACRPASRHSSITRRPSPARTTCCSCQGRCRQHVAPV